MNRMALFFLLVVASALAICLALRWGMFGLSILALAVFLVAMRFYPLGKPQVEEMRVRLEQLHQQKAAQLTRD